MPRKITFEAVAAVPEHLELLRHRISRLAREKGLTADYLARALGFASTRELLRAAAQKYPTVAFVEAAAALLGVDAAYLEETVPIPRYKVTVRLRKLLSADDRAIDRFAGYRLNKEIRKMAREKLAEIAEEIDRKRPMIDAGREPYLAEEAKLHLADRYKISLGQLALYLDHSDRWRDELEEEIDRLSKAH